MAQNGRNFCKKLCGFCDLITVSPVYIMRGYGGEKENMKSKNEMFNNKTHNK